MGVRYSYDGFTTKGHGVIEGPSKVHAGSRDALYTFYKKLPKRSKIICTTEDISAITKRYTYVSKHVVKQINKELKHGYVLRFRSGEFVKRNDAGKIEIYKPSRGTKGSVSKPVNTHKNQVNSAYNHLLKIHNKAKNK